MTSRSIDIILPTKILQRVEFCGCQLTPLSGSQSGELEMGDRHAHQSQRGKIDGCGHSTHLTIAPLGQR